MVIVILPRYAARVVQYIKGQSSEALREKFSFLEKVSFSRGWIWMKKGIFFYVEHQEREDKGQLPAILKEEAPGSC